MTGVAYFKLIYEYEGETLEKILEDEPIKWDAVEIILKRDADYYGFNYEYTDENVELQFDKLSGFSIIEKVYKKYGNDGNIILEYGTKKGNKYYPEYQGKLNLNLYSKEVEKGQSLISCTVETSGIHETINTRKDTAVNLWDLKNLDNGDMSALRWSKIGLKSSSIDRKTEVSYETSTGIDASFTNDYVYGSHPFWFLMGFDSQDGEDDIKDFMGSACTIMDNGLFESSLTDSLITPLVLAQENGSLKFDFSKIGIGMYLHGHMDKESGIWNGPPSFEKLDVFMFLIKVPAGESISFDHLDTSKADWVIRSNGSSDDRFDGQDADFDIKFTGSKSIDVEIGDQVFLIYKIEWDYAGNKENCTFELTQRARALKVVSKTTAPESDCYCITIKDALKTIVESITGQNNLVKSDLLDYASGAFGKYVLASGFGLRNFDNPEIYSDSLKPFNLSLKDFISSLRAVIPISISYERDTEGNQTFTLEDILHCFQDNEILTLEDVSDLKYETAKELIYNEAEIGYSKYPDDGSKLLDEYNTKLVFSLPIKTNKNKLGLLSSFVAANYAIEETRRYQFRVDTDETKDTSETSTKWDENVFIIATTDDMKSEGQENFEAKNISGDGNLYNLRITPKRNIYRWAIWINGGLSHKENTELIKNTSYVKNGKASTTILNNTDIAGEIIEKDDIQLINFNDRKRIFYPEWITLKARITKDKLETLRDALTKTEHDLKNGYVSFYDGGVKVQGWPWEIRYNPNTEKVSLKLLKKDLILSIGQGNCQDYRNYTSADFEALKTLPDFIEDCTFDNFK